MKRFITVFGSLMIIAGLKAQKAPDIRKETTPAVKTNGIDSMKSKSALPDKQQTSGVIPKTNPVNSNPKAVPSKYSPVVKPEKINPAALPDKQGPVTKPTKQ